MLLFLLDADNDDAADDDDDLFGPVGDLDSIENADDKISSRALSSAML